MTKRINYIDRMKGFAILVVVLAHVFLFAFDMGDCSFFKFCVSFEMPLFMFVSGFVAYLQPQSGGAIYKKLTKRFVSYVCPAFMVSYILALYSYFILGNREINVINTLIGGFWYLKALAIFVCLQAILIRCKSLWLELLVIAVAEGTFLVGWKTSPFLYQLLCLEHCFFFYPFFMMGYYFRKYKLVDFLKNINWVFTVSIVGYICLLNANVEIHALRFLSERVLIPSFAILAITYSFASREDKDSKFEKWLTKMGTKTLDIYMYHRIFLFGTFAIFDLKVLKCNELMIANPILFFIRKLLSSNIAVGHMFYTKFIFT